jgi:nudix-type nucleoside diphosphatase (YffH/AdpP family)
LKPFGGVGAEVMTDLFVYGTLRHVPLLEIVLGRPAARIDLAVAHLADHAAMAAMEGPFPLIAAKMGHLQAGLVLNNLSDEDLARLDFYEGGFDYTLERKTTSEGQGVDVYFPPLSGVTANGLWDLADWETQWAPLTCIAAHEVMSFYGERNAQDIVRMFPMIRARAASNLNAHFTKHGQGTLDGRVDVAKKTREYTDFFALDSYDLSHERFNGSMTENLSRAVFVGTDAAILLPYDPKRDCVLLVEQMRMGPLGRGDTKLWQLEPIAGRVDAGETPAQCAIREAQEEAGLSITTLEPVCEAYPSPGCSTEFFFQYVGITNLPDDIVGVSGLETENEDIRSHLLSFDALMALVQSQQAANVPLVTLAYWLAFHRPRLRGLT